MRKRVDTIKGVLVEAEESAARVVGGMVLDSITEAEQMELGDLTLRSVNGTITEGEEARRKDLWIHAASQVTEGQKESLSPIGRYILGRVLAGDI